MSNSKVQWLVLGLGLGVGALSWALLERALERSPSAVDLMPSGGRGSLVPSEEDGAGSVRLDPGSGTGGGTADGPLAVADPGLRRQDAVWLEHKATFERLGSLALQPSADSKLGRDPKLLAGLARLFSSLAEAFPDRSASELQDMMCDVVVQGELLGSIGQGCSARPALELVREFEAVKARVKSEIDEDGGASLVVIHRARLMTYLAARATQAGECLQSFDRAAVGVILTLDRDVRLPMALSGTDADASRFLLQGWTQMYGIDFGREQVDSSVEIAEAWWRAGSLALNRLVRDHGEAMELAIRDPAKALEVSAADGLRSILELRIAMAELQDLYGRRLLALAPSMPLVKDRPGRRIQLFLAGRYP